MIRRIGTGESWGSFSPMDSGLGFGTLLLSACNFNIHEKHIRRSSTLFLLGAVSNARALLKEFM